MIDAESQKYTQQSTEKQVSLRLVAVADITVVTDTQWCFPEAGYLDIFKLLSTLSTASSHSPTQEGTGDAGSLMRGDECGTKGMRDTSRVTSPATCSRPPHSTAFPFYYSRTSLLPALHHSSHIVPPATIQLYRHTTQRHAITHHRTS
ncbi:hypothetical protein E2C01_047271 [Portunus trituberculatus]|uniref:Uncharacterized protein n=1 Tax=Portunus trituberculatus TaxID=210409 RepID=A0A5B7G371_PORTR|nr:hypothetical protein [Portunus trituberculatus]